MKCKYYWFYIEPFVHFSIKKDTILLFNTLNGKVIKFIRNRELFDLINELAVEKNLLIIKLSSEDLKNPRIHSFVSEARKNYMGDILDMEWSIKKPFQFVPCVNLLQDEKKLQNEGLLSIGEDILDYLFELTFYINTKSRHHSAIFKSGYKQFLCPKNIPLKGKEIVLREVINFINQAIFGSLFNLNFLGGNILEYSEIKNLVKELQNISVLKNYYLYYLDIYNSESLNIFKNLHNVELKILFDFPFEIKNLERILSNCFIKNLSCQYIFIIEKEKDYNLAFEVINKFDIKEYLIKPFFNGNNYNFFKKYMFYNKQEIYESKPDLREIFINSKINLNSFGKLIILNNGSVYANVNERRISKIGQDFLIDIIREELVNGRSWTKLRANIAPCSQCVLEKLCPPLSNYEYILKQNNLCYL